MKKRWKPYVKLTVVKYLDVLIQEVEAANDEESEEEEVEEPAKPEPVKTSPKKAAAKKPEQKPAQKRKASEVEEEADNKKAKKGKLILLYIFSNLPVQRRKSSAASRS